MRPADAASSLVAMTTDLLKAHIGPGAPMIGVLLAIAAVGGFVYLVSGRSPER
jgi:hypothetical protein